MLRARAIRCLEQKAAELWSQVPAVFPDGTPFRARTAFEEVVALGRLLILSSPPNGAELMGHCLNALAGLATVADPASYTVHASIQATTARRLLLRDGLAAWDQTLTRALLLTVRYHRKAGHRPSAADAPELPAPAVAHGPQPGLRQGWG
ncbi:hypothetical protein AB0K43_13320 [Kitasatospora sp. NPDC049258]|uniref:hypothetical protein n=1 Tax=Kitasatospora sp. NPDC049258 TaxID=3155394 RepID=UPI003437FD09